MALIQQLTNPEHSTMAPIIQELLFDFTKCPNFGEVANEFIKHLVDHSSSVHSVTMKFPTFSVDHLQKLTEIEMIECLDVGTE